MFLQFISTLADFAVPKCLHTRDENSFFGPFFAVIIVLNRSENRQVSLF